MIRTEVKSTAITAVTLNDNAVMTVEFCDGATADYPETPVEFYTEFVTADSVGRFFNKYVRPLTKRA